MYTQVKEELRTLAYESGYQSVETTQNARDEYSSHSCVAITGFDNWEEAEKFAKENNLRLYLLERKAGRSLWLDRNNWLLEPYKATEEDYGGSASYLANTDEDEIAQTAKDLIGGIEDMETIFDIVKHYKDVWEAIQELDNDEMVVEFDNMTFEVEKRYPLSWEYDSTYYMIAAMPEDRYDHFGSREEEE